MFQFKFWGVRGTIPCASKEYELYGGNTSCVCVILDDHCIILDAGTGIFPLGKWMQQQKIKHASLFLSHTHFDHIVGLPFFSPLWDQQFKLDIYTGIFCNSSGINDFFERYMNHPLFPGSLKEMAKAQLNLYDIEPGKYINLTEGIEVKTLSLNHPGGSTGYRINYKGKSLCYLTDIEHKIGKHDQEVISFISDSNCLIYDTMYLPTEHKDKIGWGHSTWEEAIALTKAANVDRLFTYHHSPDHTDDILQNLESQIQKQYPQAQISRQGLSITL